MTLPPLSPWKDRRLATVQSRRELRPFLLTLSSGRRGTRWSTFSRLVLGHVLILLFVTRFCPSNRQLAGYVNGEAGTRRLDAQSNGGEALSWWSTIAAQSEKAARSTSTSVHCVGENYSPYSWKYRSCEFRDLCYDPARREFVATESREGHDLSLVLEAFAAHEREFITLSTMLDPTRSSVSLGTASVDPWFPRVVAHEELLEHSPRVPGSAGQAQSVLPHDVVLVPISVGGSSSNYLIWDVLYPVYTLLSLFGLEEKRAVLMILDHKESIEDVRRRLEVLLEHMDKSMMILAPSAPSATGSVPGGSTAPWICSTYTVAGLGLRRRDGNDVESDDNLHKSNSFHWNIRSVAEGISLWSFRSYLMKGLRMQQVNVPDTKSSPIHITVQGTLQSQFTALQSAFPSEQVQYRRLTPQEDVAAVASAISSSLVLVTSLDEWREIDFGLVTFLPPNSYLLILVDNVDSLSAHSPYGMRKMDWDLLNAAGYFHVRILPRNDNEALVSNLRNIFDFVRHDA